MNVSLTPEWERFVKEQIDAGRFESASEVVREALRLLHDHQRFIEDVDGKIERGLADLASGRTFDAEEARAVLSARRRART